MEQRSSKSVEQLVLFLNSQVNIKGWMKGGRGSNIRAEMLALWALLVVVEVLRV